MPTQIVTEGYFDGNRIDGVSGQWTRSITEIRTGIAEVEVARQKATWVGGEWQLGDALPMGRAIELVIYSAKSGSYTSAIGGPWAEIQALNDVFSPAYGQVYLKTVRPDADASSVTRRIKVQVMGMPSYEIIPDGMSGSGVIGKQTQSAVLYTVPLYAAWPYWEDDTLQDETGIVSGAAATTVPNAGPVRCGVRLTCTAKTGTTATVTITEATSGDVVGLTGSIAVNDYVDFWYTDPTAVSWSLASAAAYVNPGSSMRLPASGNGSITVAQTGATNITFKAEYRRQWGTL